jgi:hypothetical protein
MRNLYPFDLAAALSILLPAAEAWRACRPAVSEGRVWGKALRLAAPRSMSSRGGEV